MNWHIQRSRPRLVRGSLATSRRIEREEARQYAEFRDGVGTSTRTKRLKRCAR